ncbi:MAG: AbrB/MazE/SpoVT family DNA-binding domain-containing protein [Acutalibacteraceae bacterium]|nr:AbrB/MazE/SpoVT family DNA-binding domain-containing protein [Acutalibacteraceae bacterium]
MSNADRKNNIIGHICTVDNLGRIVIPSTMRKSYNIEKGEKIELLAMDEGILLRKYQPGCMFCGNISDITLFEGHIICRDCLKKMTKELLE